MKTPKILPPTYFMILLSLSVGSHFWFPISRIAYPSYTRVLGIMFIGFGATLNMWSDYLFKKNKTTVKPHEAPTTLETSGPFRISRHPMYFGMTLILLGVAMLTRSLSSVLLAALFAVLMDVLFIRLEEKTLERLFGEKYVVYKKKVRRWV